MRGAEPLDFSPEEEISSYSVSSVIRFANEKFDQGDYKLALKYYEACVIGTNGTDPRLWLAMAHCHCGLNNSDIALEMSKYAYSLDRSFTDALVLMVVIYANGGKWGELIPLLNNLKLLDKNELLPYLISAHIGYLSSMPKYTSINVGKVEEILSDTSNFNSGSKWTEDLRRYFSLVINHFKIGGKKMTHDEINNVMSKITDKKTKLSLNILKNAIEFEQIESIIRTQTGEDITRTYELISSFRKEHPTEDDVNLLYAVVISTDQFRPEVHTLLINTPIGKSSNYRPLSIPALAYLSIGTNNDYRTSILASQTLLSIIQRSIKIIVDIGKNNNTINSKICSKLSYLCNSDSGCLIAAGILMASPLKVIGESRVEIINASSFISRLFLFPEIIEDENAFEYALVCLCTITSNYILKVLHNSASSSHILAKTPPLFSYFIESASSRTEHVRSALGAYSLALLIGHLIVKLGNVTEVESEEFNSIIELAVSFIEGDKIFPNAFYKLPEGLLEIDEEFILTAKQMSLLCLSEGYTKIGYSLLYSCELKRKTSYGLSLIGRELYKDGVYPFEYFKYLIADGIDGKTTEPKVRIVSLEMTHPLSNISLKALNRNISNYNVIVDNKEHDSNYPLIPVSGAISKLDRGITLYMQSMRYKSQRAQLKSDADEKEIKRLERKYLSCKEEVQKSFNSVYTYVINTLKSDGDIGTGSNSINTYSIALCGFVLSCIIANDGKYMTYIRNNLSPESFPIGILNQLKPISSNDSRLLAELYFISGCVCLGYGGSNSYLRSQERAKMSKDALDFFIKAARAGILTLSNESHYVNSIINKNDYYLLPADVLPMTLELYSVTAAFDRAVSLHDFDMMLYLRILRTMAKLCREYPTHGMFSYNYAYAVKVFLKKVGKNLDISVKKMEAILEHVKHRSVTELRQLKRLTLEENPLELLKEFECHINNSLSNLSSHVALAEQDPSIYEPKQLSHDDIDAIDTAPFFSSSYLGAFGVSRVTEAIIYTKMSCLNLRKAKNVLRLNLQVIDGVPQIQSFRSVIEQLDEKIRGLIGSIPDKISKDKEITKELQKRKQRMQLEAIRRGNEAREEMMERIRTSQQEQETRALERASQKRGGRRGKQSGREYRDDGTNFSGYTSGENSERTDSISNSEGFTYSD